MITEIKRQEYIEMLIKNDEIKYINIFVDLAEKKELEETLVRMFNAQKKLSTKALQDFIVWISRFIENDMNYRYDNIKNTFNLERIYIFGTTAYHTDSELLYKLQENDILYRKWYKHNILYKEA